MNNSNMTDYLHFTITIYIYILYSYIYICIYINCQHPLSPYLIGLITTGNSVLQLLRKAVYVAQTLCICQAVWPCGKLGYLIEFRLQRCCNLDRSAQPGELLGGPFFGHECSGERRLRHFKRKFTSEKRLFKSCQILTFSNHCLSKFLR